MKGTIKTWHHRKGFGFIAVEDGEDIFLHITDIPEKQKPEIGEVVTFDVGPGRDGKTKAINVKLTSQAASPVHGNGDGVSPAFWIGLIALAAVITLALIFFL